MSTRSLAPDFAMAPEGDLRACPWFRPLTVALVGEPPPNDAALIRFMPRLLDAIRGQGHEVLDRAEGRVHLMLGFAEVPDGPGPLLERIPERETPLGLALVREFGLPRRPENLVAVITVPERLADRPHIEVVEAARAAMGRVGAPKIVFLSVDRERGEVLESTYCTLEGGHPTDREAIPERLRDRLIAMASATEVGGRYEVVPGAIPRAVWEATRTPEAVVAAGHRMDRLGLLPPPRRIIEYVEPRLSRIYEKFFGLKGFSEGMIFAYDPDTGTTMVTASGSWDVDKRALRREEVVPLGRFRDSGLEVLAPEGVKPKGPSVEAWEIVSLLESVPHVRLRKLESGGWTPDPGGPVEAPIIRAGIHAHVGVIGIDEGLVETVPANRRLFPYGFGCGTDLMSQVARDAAERSRAINDPDDGRAYVRWPMLYHGDTAVELWKPGVAEQPLQGLLDLYDPAALGAIEFSLEHVEQPV